MNRTPPLARTVAVLAVFALLAVPAAAAGPEAAAPGATPVWVAWVETLAAHLGFAGGFTPEDSTTAPRSTVFAAEAEEPEDPTASSQSCTLDCGERSGTHDPNG